MKIICAWCQSIIREEDGSGEPDSHGICEKCRDIYYPKGGQRKKKNSKNTVQPPTKYKSMEPNNVVAIFRNNLDEISQPILRAIYLLRSLSRDFDKKGQKYYLAKNMADELDEILNLIAHLYQTVWFSLEFGMNNITTKRYCQKPS